MIRWEKEEGRLREDVEMKAGKGDIEMKVVVAFQSD